MISRGQKIRLGLFVLISLFALASLLFLLTRQRLFKKYDVYHIAFEGVSVSGLEVGSPVKYLGVRVGTIRDIRIDPKNVNRILVTVALEPGTPIRQDARADIVSVGITGLKMIEIRGGSQKAPLLKPGSFIHPGTSISDEITGKAEVIAEKAEMILNNLQRMTSPQNIENYENFLANARQAFEQMDAMLKENRSNLRESLAQSRELVDRLTRTSRLLEESVRQIHAFSSSDTLGEILGNTRELTSRLRKANLVELVQEMGELLRRTNRLLAKLDINVSEGSDDLVRSMIVLRSTLEHLNNVVRTLEEDPSVLLRGVKHRESPDELLEK
ncbi:MAG: MCE family protein [Calditrichaeota bacterium]|nr:MAG: MCE family protein [Calditrichota bacterium]